MMREIENLTKFVSMIFLPGINHFNVEKGNKCQKQKEHKILKLTKRHLT